MAVARAELTVYEQYDDVESNRLTTSHTHMVSDAGMLQQHYASPLSSNSYDQNEVHLSVAVADTNSQVQLGTSYHSLLADTVYSNVASPSMHLSTQPSASRQPLVTMSN
jgi:hypothetical protein